MIKPRDVIYNNKDAPCLVYGRVSRILANGRVETIDCGRFVRICDPKDLTVADYAGYWDGEQHGATEVRIKFPVWQAMPSLRKLKAMAARYDKSVWKKHRKRPK
jgi:hypothetical protein